MSEALEIARGRALDAYVEQLRQWCLFGRVTDAGEGRTPIDIERNLPVVVTFDRDQLARYFDAAVIADSPSATVVTELVALLLKIVADIERIGESLDDDAEEFYSLRAELILDSTLGSALIDRLTAQISDPESDFRPDEAIYLVEVIGRLRRAVADAESMITETERVRTALQAVSPPALLPASNDPDEAAAEPGAPPSYLVRESSGELDQQRWIRLRGRSAAPPRGRLPTTVLRKHRRLRLRTIVLVLLLGGAALVRMDSLDARNLASDAPQLSLEQGELIQKVENLPPALYVDVRPGPWERLHSVEREQILEETAKSADRAGYEGIVWRFPDGRIVAQWWSRRGVELVSP